MIEFVAKVLPSVAVAISLMLFAVNYIAKKNAKGDIKKYENNMLEGMCLGVLLGLAFGGNGVAYGMFIGTVVGMCIKRTEKSENKQEPTK